MEQTTPNEFGETLMELSAEAAATLAAETDEERLKRAASIAAAEEWKHDFKALLLLNMEETKRISNTYRGRSGIGEVMEAAVLKIRIAYFEAKAEAKAVAQEMALAQAEEQAQLKAKAMAKAKAAA
jgi:hypothetical protein